MISNLFSIKKDQPQPITFQRGPGATIIGLLHTITGFLVTLFAAARILLIGYEEPFRYSIKMGLYNMAFESSSVLLWISGIGILRGKKWGMIIGAVWGILSIFFHISAHIIRKNNWGDFAPSLSWGDYIIIYYSIAFIAGTAYIIFRKKK